MKKLLLILVLGLFALNSNAVSFSNNFQTDCTQLAMDIYDSWTSQGFTDRVAGGEADRAYNRCISHNGSPTTEAIISN